MQGEHLAPSGEPTHYGCSVSGLTLVQGVYPCHCLCKENPRSLYGNGCCVFFLLNQTHHLLMDLTSSGRGWGNPWRSVLPIFLSLLVGAKLPLARGKKKHIGRLLLSLPVCIERQKRRNDKKFLYSLSCFLLCPFSIILIFYFCRFVAIHGNSFWDKQLCCDKNGDKTTTKRHDAQRLRTTSLALFAATPFASHIPWASGSDVHLCLPWRAPSPARGQGISRFVVLCYYECSCPGIRFELRRCIPSHVLYCTEY